MSKEWAGDGAADGADGAERALQSLVAGLATVRRHLETHLGRNVPERVEPPVWPEGPDDGPPGPLGRLRAEFQLTGFELSVLLLAAGLELDHQIAELAAAAGGATLALALSAFPEAHYGAIGRDAPLRHWRLIELDPGPSLVGSPLRIDETMLGFLLGETSLDPRLAEPAAAVPPAPLTPSQVALAERLAWAWRAAPDDPPILHLVEARDGAPAAGVARAVCDRLGLGLTSLSARALPLAPAEADLTARLCERHARLSGGALLLSHDAFEDVDPAREAALALWLNRVAAPMIITGPRRRRTGRRPVLTFKVDTPTAREQRALWRRALGDTAGADGAARRLASHFDLPAGAFESVALDAVSAIRRAEATPDAAVPPLGEALWDAARRQARPRLDDLAQRVTSAAGWSDLVLPEPQLELLRTIEAQLSHRSTVHEDWGFAGKGERGLGLAVLFAGASGAGKTTAAEILARELRLDLYRIDLSAVVSKYIGETEKNLRRVFDAAEAGGCILLFDEADALFGKRTEVTDSHDRHANIEVSYLLQRIETFRGLAILTSNLRGSMDPAFLRRLRFIVTFPFPDAGLRARIWRGMFPAETPTSGLDFARLGQLSLTGGQIRSVALNAAFLAAARAAPVDMSDLRAAARMEYAKQEKSLNEAELRGWPT